MAGRIERLSSWDAHRLVASQVVPDVGLAVKELVENALDAGAQSIEVKLTNAGLDAVVVADDGAGIATSDFAAVARLHATSKLERWEQLAGVLDAPDSSDVCPESDSAKGASVGIQTFGFRGEALSSLCALSEKVTVLTASADTAPRGSLLSFTPEGELEADGVVAQARPRGTTVTVTNLFSRLPVRQREAQKHSRRDLTRVLHWITAYALIAPDVRWICSNTPKNGRRQVLLQLTPAKPAPALPDGPPAHYMANASSLLGKKAAAGLLPVHMTIHVPVPHTTSSRKRATRVTEDNEDDEELPAAERLKRRIRRAQQTSSSDPADDASDSQAAPETVEIILDGLVSRPARSYGQRTNAAQYYYLNGRPWDAPPALVKAFNDVWRSFHTNDLTTTSGSLRGGDLASSTTSASHVFPFVLAHFSAPGAATDTTLSKDKRTMHLLNERGLVDSLRTSLEEFYSPLRATYAVQASQPQTMQTSLHTYRHSRTGQESDPPSDESPPDASTQLLSRLRSRVAAASSPAPTPRSSRSRAPIPKSAPSHAEDSVESDAAAGADDLSPEGDDDEADEEEEELRPLDGPAQAQVIHEATLEAGPETNEPEDEDEEEQGLEVTGQGEDTVLSDPDSDDSDAMLTQRLWRESQAAARSRAQQAGQTRGVSPAADEEEDKVDEMDVDHPIPSGPEPESEPETEPEPELEQEQEQLNERPDSSSPETDELSPEGAEADETEQGLGHPGKGGALAAASALREAFRSRQYASQRARQTSPQRARSSPSRPVPVPSAPAPLGRTVRRSPLPPVLAAREVLREPRGTKRPAAVVDRESEEDHSGTEEQEVTFVDEILVDHISEGKHGSPHRDGHEGCGCSSGSGSRCSPRSVLEEEEEANQTILVPPDRDTDSDAESVDQLQGERVEGSTLTVPLDALCSLASPVKAPEPSALAAPARRDDGVGAGAAEAAFDNPDTAAVERALSRTIAQDDFLSMQVVGQFNHAFIIVRRAPSGGDGDTVGEDDLFIVDQHAADEKANFERLTRDVPVRTQSLLVPRTLELSAADELVAEEHLGLLQESGFGLAYQPSRAPGARIQLLAQPVVAGVTLGPSDLDELLTQLASLPRSLAQSPFQSQAGSQVPGCGKEARWTAKATCSKARAALAMRACRSSIMVGTPLERDRMQRVVAGLAGLDMPWNCPHGRPTMRHLLDLHDPALGLAAQPPAEVDWAAFAAQD